MKTFNYGDPYTRRLNLRLSDSLYVRLLLHSEKMGVSPSDLIRRMLDMYLEVNKNEDVKTPVNN